MPGLRSLNFPISAARLVYYMIPDCFHVIEKVFDPAYGTTTYRIIAVSVDAETSIDASDNINYDRRRRTLCIKRVKNSLYWKDKKIQDIEQAFAIFDSE